MGNYHTNNDGLTQHYETRDVAGGVNQKPAVRRTNRSGLEQELVVDFDFNALAQTAAAAGVEWWDEDSSLNGSNFDRPSNLHAFVPANSTIIACDVYVKTGLAGGGGLAVGVYQLDGTVIDVDGLVVPGAEGATANIAADGDVVAGAGALVGANVGANDAYIGAFSDGAITAGEARVVVRYVKERDSV